MSTRRHGPSDIAACTHTQDGNRHGPLRGGARACTTAWAVGTTVHMSTRRHGPAVIAAHTHETAAGTPPLQWCSSMLDGMGRRHDGVY